MNSNIIIYTDGSCHTQHKIGAWSTIIFYNHQKVVLSGTAVNTTNQRMELLAVLNAMEYVDLHLKNEKNIQLNSDSQYVIGLIARAEKLQHKNFITKAGNEIRNIDLVLKWLAYNKQFNIQLTKIKAHQTESEENRYNIEVDKLSRKLVRDLVRDL